MQLTVIGKDPGLTAATAFGLLHFHYLNFLNPSFMHFDMTLDAQEQSVSCAISQFQPNLGANRTTCAILGVSNVLQNWN